MNLAQFDYELPADLIATTPVEMRDESRLLVVDNSHNFIDEKFKNIVNHLQAGDLLVLNDTAVFKARLFAHKRTGGKVELLLEKILDNNTFIAQIKTSGKLKLGMEFVLHNAITATIISFHATQLFLLQLQTNDSRVIDMYHYCECFGEVPLPPYMHRQAQATDTSNYQTVYAKHRGSVAAPTAGLHFTHALLAQIQARGINIAYITLHIGSGTFKPIKHHYIADHTMHAESFVVTEQTIALIKATKAAGKQVICVGTTAARTLESIADNLIPQQSSTSLYIMPGYKFKLVDRLITNFHLPKSSLLVFIAAFSSLPTVMAAYQHAIAQHYRFFSYGDAMLLTLKCS